MRNDVKLVRGTAVAAMTHGLDCVQDHLRGQLGIRCFTTVHGWNSTGTMQSLLWI